MFIESLEKRQFLSTAPTTPKTTVLFEDTFSGTAVDQSKWTVPYGTGFMLGKSQIAGQTTGGAPKESGGLLHLTVNTYNPYAPGASLLGSEVDGNQTYTLGKSGALQVSFRARLLQKPGQTMTGGLVMGMFMYGANGNHEELDWEPVTNQAIKSGAKTGATNLFERTGSCLPALVSLPAGFSFYDYHTYTTRWQVGVGVSWYIDGKCIRTEPRYVPTGPMRVIMNFWASDDGWTTAAALNLHPAALKSENQTYELDIDKVEVDRLS